MSWPHSCFVLVLLIHQGILLSVVHGSTKVHIVYMGERKHDDVLQVQDSHHQMLENVLGSKEAAAQSILYSYRHGFSGFAAILTESQADHISDVPGVVSVIPNKILQGQTTRSWDFLHVNQQSANGVLSKAHSGAGTIIGVIDSGIWPESESFRDDGMTGVPSHWRGVCQGGEQFNKSDCNSKIIGARWYIKGYEAELGMLNRSAGPEFLSPRDAVSHGTHTASTAAGAFVDSARYGATLAAGLARGGAPSAHLAVYKACWVSGSCSSADILAAFDDAISDGVDVLSVSISSSPPYEAYLSDAIAVGSFHAVGKGISVVTAAGNSGPHSQTVAGLAPWLLTVAASTIDRAFPSAITLGNNRTLGKTWKRFHPLVYGGEIALYSGAIKPVVKFRHTATMVGHQSAPEVAFFSSRGPSSLFPHVLKPDIAAPGVNILAAWSPVSIIDPTPGPPQNFKIESGTSMACPHVAGITALLKTIHPTWTPAAIKSAIITTASIRDEYGQRIVAESLPHKEADPFDYGGSHIEPNKAVYPGLVYDMKTLDYVHFLCASGLSSSGIRHMYMTKFKIKCRKEKDVLINLYLPSISIPELKRSITVSRTVINVGPTVSVYKARVEAPPGVTVKVEPSVLAFNFTAKKLKFKATFISQLRVQGRYSFGYLYWEDGLHVVRSPLVVRTVLEDFYSVT